MRKQVLSSVRSEMSRGIVLARDGKLIVAAGRHQTDCRNRCAERKRQRDRRRSASADRACGCAEWVATNIPSGVGVGASGMIYVSSDIENAVYKVTKK